MLLPLVQVTLHDQPRQPHWWTPFTLIPCKGWAEICHVRVILHFGVQNNMCSLRVRILGIDTHFSEETNQEFDDRPFFITCRGAVYLWGVFQ